MDWEVEAMIYAAGLAALALIIWAGWMMVRSSGRQE
jgi:hypothetical protein